MTVHKYFKTFAIFALLLVSNANFVFADDDAADDSYNYLSTSLLDGITMFYSYIDVRGSSYRVSWEDGLEDWSSIDIEFDNGDIKWKHKGTTVKGSPYKAYKWDTGIYMAYFTETSAEGNLEFVTLYIDLNKNQVFAASLFNYGEHRSGPHRIHWAPGFIYSVSQEN